MMVAVMCGFSKRSCLIFFIFCIYLIIYSVKDYLQVSDFFFASLSQTLARTTKYNDDEEHVLSIRHKKNVFMKNFNEMLLWKLDHRYFHQICAPFEWKRTEAIPWFERTRYTDFTKGKFVTWNINPAMEFSSITLQTRYKNGTEKHEGGDYWRVSVKGPSNIPVIRRDLKNGSYEFKFLPLSAGVYRVYITLEYTLCAGLKEPPQNWFVKGTVQGKEQRQGSLYRDFPFINKDLWSGEPVYVTIKPKEISLTEYNTILNDTCNCQNRACKFLWNGLGGWVNKTNWKSLCPYSFERHYSKKMRSGVLWMFGDSVTTQFYHLIKKNPICKEIFRTCMYTYNWLYSLENYNHTLHHYTRRNTSVEKTLWDSKDFSVIRLLIELKQVLLHPAMNQDSVLIMNYGLHFTESANYTNFQSLIRNVITLIKNEAKCKIMWKTTSALNRHKYSQPNLHSRRFMTSPRVEQYNAFATKAFCDAGYDVIDIYSLTESYPEGTGSDKSPHDPVHYEYHVMRPVEELLERAFGIS